MSGTKTGVVHVLLPHVASKKGGLRKYTITLHPTRVELERKHKKTDVLVSPLHLTWIDPQGELIGQQFEDYNRTFAIIGPRGVHIIIAKDANEKDNWVNLLTRAIRNTFNNDNEGDEIREGHFRFESGHYQGMWKNGKLHGEGAFTDLNGIVFSGRWDAGLQAGYGTIKKSNDVEYAGGWDHLLPNGLVKEVVEVSMDAKGVQEFISSDHLCLTEKDWDLLNSNATLRAYESHEIILRDGDPNENLFQIKSGKVRVEVDVKGKPKVLDVLRQTEVFGELSAIDKRRFSGAVIADTDVEVYVIPADRVKDVFKAHSGLFKRFYAHLAMQLSRKLSALDNPKFKHDRAYPKHQQTYSGLLVPKSLGPVIQGENVSSLAQIWLDKWSSDTIEQLVECFSESVIYRDPIAPHGIKGTDALEAHYTKLFQLYPSWKWIPSEMFGFPGGFTLRAKLRLTIPGTPTSKQRLFAERALVLAVLDQEEKIRRCELYFDISRLDSDETPEPMDMKDVLDTPIKRSSTDIHYCNRFDLPNHDETILKEYFCSWSFTSGMGSPQANDGHLYISQRYVCFYYKLFGLMTKEVIPIRHLQRVEQLNTDLVLRVDRKAATYAGARIQLSDSGKMIEVLIGFSKLQEVEEASKAIELQISELVEGGGKDFNPPKTPKTIENWVVRTMHQSKLPQEVPKINLKPITRDIAVRISGPQKDEGLVFFGNDVCGQAVSGYPFQINGESRTRLGDPICDQFCVERLPNRTIIGVADGCSWGEKVAAAAKVAARTFVEFVRRGHTTYTNTQQVVFNLLQAFAHAHLAIMSNSEHGQAWECGTTTLIGGILTQIYDRTKKWAFVCASVGDCKAYHFCISERTVSDINRGSRHDSITDAKDCGGRLGPYIEESKPDLRNLGAYVEYVDEGDIIMLCSDGVFDNFDPQHFGITPASLDPTVGEGSWNEIDPAVAERLKHDYCVTELKKIMDRLLDASPDNSLNVQTLVKEIIAHCLAATKASRTFMEEHPDVKLPSDYSKFQGKMDHTTCVCVKVCQSAFTNEELSLDKLVMRVRHPRDGVKLGLPSKVGQTTRILQNLRTGSGSISSSIPRAHQIAKMGVFKGEHLLQWMKKHTGEKKDLFTSLDPLDACQRFLGFKYIAPNDAHAQERYTTETFDPNMEYKFLGYEPTMSPHDWALLMQVATIQTYNKGDFIVKEGRTHKSVYQIVRGKCIIERDTNVVERSTSRKDKERKAKRNLESSESSDDSRPSIRRKVPRKRKLGSKKKKVYLGTMLESETFGEVSFFHGGGATASVIADSDGTQICAIEGTMLNILFSKHPELAGRFYHYLASVLAVRIRQKEEMIFGSKQKKKSPRRKQESK